MSTYKSSLLMMLINSLLQNLVIQTIQLFSQFCGLAVSFHGWFCLSLFMWLFGWRVNDQKVQYGLTLMPGCWCWLQTKAARSPLQGLLSSVHQTISFYGEVRTAIQEHKSRIQEVAWTSGSRIPIASLLSHSITDQNRNRASPYSRDALLKYTPTSDGSSC